jgi:uncharacterized membrane protein YfcA
MELDNLQWSILAGITLFGAVAQSAIGFGFALIAVPVFLLVLNVEEAVQIAMVLSMAISVVMIFPVYRDIPRLTSRNLLVGSVFGFPLGFLFYSVATPELIKLVVAVSIIVALLCSYLKKRISSHLRETTSITIAAGVVSGAMVTSIAMAGPAVAVFAVLTGMNKAATRATIFCVFIFSYGCAILLHAVIHGFSSETVSHLYTLLPVTLFGVFLGHSLAGRISEKVFSKLISFTLIGVALWLVYSSI